MRSFRFLISALILFSLASCGSGASSNSGGSGSGSGSSSNGSGGSEKSSCACSSSDARRLANLFVNNFTQIQNNLPSDVARVMRIDDVDARDNCTWVVTFKVSWPFGNTDGAHPDEYIKKRYACDGKEIYEQ